MHVYACVVAHMYGSVVWRLDVKVGRLSSDVHRNRDFHWSGNPGDPSVAASTVLGFQRCATTPGLSTLVLVTPHTRS